MIYDADGVQPQKYCSKCKDFKILTNFPLLNQKRTPGRRGAACNICKAEASAKWYAHNQDLRLASDARRRTVNSHKIMAAKCSKRGYEKSKLLANIRIEFINWLKSAPCVDCTKCYIACVMDFDHLPGQIKVGIISKLCKRPKAVSDDSLMDEILKCELVCANCHRIRIFLRKH